MDLKTTCIMLNIVAAVSLLAVPCVSMADSAVATSAQIAAGGQAPPPAAGGAGFAVRVARNLDQASASNLQKDLINEGFTGAQARQAADGTHEVVIGGMASRAQAEGIVSELKNSGYTTNVEVVSEGGDAAGAAAGAGEQTVYRVKVAEFDTEAQATEASKVLVDEGFVNVDIAEENGKHVLMLGTFNKEGDAQALLGDVNRAGFAMASVISIERLRSGTSAGTADVSALPAGEQGLARQVLEMAQKVERGEASADEVKQLREMVQQMTSTQRQVLTQQESTRAASQDKNQRIFQLYREFDKAINAQDYARAEQILNEVRQIDPDDIFLPQRVATLENRRSGGTAAAPGAAPGRPDPAALQSLINDARAAETAGNTSLAADKYNQVLAMDPSNAEARSKVAQLNAATGAEETTGGAGGLMENKTLLYGIGGAVVAVILLLLWLKSRGSRATKEPTPAAGTGFETAGYNGVAAPGVMTPGTPGGLGTGLSGGGLATGIPDYTVTETTGEEEERTATPPPVAAAPAPAEPESDVVSLGDFEQGPGGAAPAAAASSNEDELVSLNFDEEPKTAPSAATPGTGKAMDADLEALLKGTFGEPEAVSAAAAAAGAGAASASTEPRIVYTQDFDSDAIGSTPGNWRGEYDYASLTVENTEDGHNGCLRYAKPEGAGSATYHLSFPNASGKVIAEFDLRCDEKNKFLLGIYLEHEEDFKQSVHTIIHQLDPNSPASLRIQGEAVPYAMGEWSHIRYEIDLPNARLDAYLNGEHVVQNAELAVAPEYVNTISIRDNLATTGTLYLDNITISEA